MRKFRSSVVHNGLSSGESCCIFNMIKLFWRERKACELHLFLTAKPEWQTLKLRGRFSGNFLLFYSIPNYIFILLIS